MLSPVLVSKKDLEEEKHIVDEIKKEDITLKNDRMMAIDDFLE